MAAAACLCLAAEAWRPRYEKGLELLQAGRAIEAREEFQAALAAGPSSGDPLVLFNLATVALESGDARTAVEFLEKAASLDPKDPLILKSLTGAYLSAGQPAAALRQADRLLALQAADAGLLAETGEMLSRAGHVSHAALFFRAARRGPAGEAAFFTRLLAEAEAQMERDRETLDRLRRQAESEPADPGPVFRLGLQWIKTGQFGLAYDVFQTAAARFPRSAEIRLGSALACYFTGRNEDAGKQYGELVKLTAGSDQAYFALGNFYLDTGRPREAIDAFRKAAARNASNYLYPYMCGVALFRAQSYREAERSLRAAVKLNPGHADSYFWLGKLLLLEGGRDKALELFERAARLEPKHAGAHYQLALLYARAGEREKSEAEFQMQRQLNAQMHRGLVALRMP